MSRAHCELVVRDGELKLIDLSRYGTFVNEKKVAGETTLQRADVIRIGSPGAELQVVEHGARAMKQRRRELNIFSMSFLDAITAGFGAVVLLFMLVNQNALHRHPDRDQGHGGRSAALGAQGAHGPEEPRADQGALQKQLEQWTALKALRQNLVSEVTETQTKLATLTEDSAARKAAIEKLKADLASLESESKTREGRGREAGEGQRGRSHPRRSRARGIANTSRACGWAARTC